MKPHEAQLKRDWLTLTAGFRVEPAAAEQLFAKLIAAYSEPARHYHNLRHIAQMLGLVEELCGKDRDLRAIRLAIWFHDVVYDAKRKDNEEQSAEFAEAAMRDLNVSATIRGRVRRLILATKGHQGRGAEVDIVLDADLSILAANRADYDAYARAIRLEYAFVEEAAYREGRSRVLESFLNRTHLFRTTVMKRREDAARMNLKRELKRLRGS